MKKVGVGLLIVIAGVAIWYFGIKKEEYQVTFRVIGTPQGTYHQILNLQTWGTTEDKNIAVIDHNLFREIAQKIVLKDTTLLLDWEIEALNDSIAEVSVSARTIEHSIANKLGVLTGETPFTKALKKELKKFMFAVNSFGKTYRIRIDGVVDVPSMAYLYVTDETRRNQKAMKMIVANANVYPVIGKYRVEKDGYPFIKVRSWEVANDSITFDFGFPIREFTSSSGILDSVPLGKRIKYGKSASFKALKATFYGNYSKSDQAWFALLNYAKEHNIEVKNEPLEIFYDNPMQGGDDTQWRAEIFMPVVE